MKITKFLHSCLLIEEGDLKVLLDPGSFSFEESALDDLPKIDYLLITHEHADHMFIPGIKKILAEYPGLKIITNPSAEAILKQEQIEVSVELPDFVKIYEVPHEKIPFGVVPANFQFDLFGKLTDPGDSHSFSQTLEILALPIQAPWGSTTAAIELALKLKPKVILPIHDYQWRDSSREGMYQRLVSFFAENDIKFIPLETGIGVEVEI